MKLLSENIKIRIFSSLTQILLIISQVKHEIKDTISTNYKLITFKKK